MSRKTFRHNNWFSEFPTRSRPTPLNEVSINGFALKRIRRSLTIQYPIARNPNVCSLKCLQVLTYQAFVESRLLFLLTCIPQKIPLSLPSTTRNNAQRPSRVPTPLTETKASFRLLTHLVVRRRGTSVQIWRTISCSRCRPQELGTTRLKNTSGGVPYDGLRSLLSC